MKKQTWNPVLLVAAGLITGLITITPDTGEAQRLRDNAGPAEVPPASFTGTQYVDSEGCVFVRAGVDGNVTWVPRVARNRQVICGFQPTNVAGATSAPVPQAQPREEVVQITPAAPAATAQASAPSPAPAPQVRTQTTTTAQAQPRTTQTTRPAQAPMRTVASGPTVITPQVIVPQGQTRTVTPAPQPTTVARGGCQGASAVSQRYISNEPGARCGPQAQPIVTLKDPSQRQIRADGSTRRVGERTVRIYAGQTGDTNVSQTTRLAPKAVYDVRGTARTVVPPGYKPAFDDDRFNPYRASQTLAGRRQMLLVWTNTLPRQLIDQRTGQNVTQMFPNVRYPNMPSSQVTVARNAGAAAQPTVIQPTVIQPSVTVSTKSAPQKTKSPAATHRYVQVGVFRPESAQVAIQRLQRAGLPVRINEFTHKGQPVRMVLSGPFKQQDQVTAALATSKRLGFPGAKLRK